jgi:hypothetical protein
LLASAPATHREPGLTGASFAEFIQPVSSIATSSRRTIADNPAAIARRPDVADFSLIAAVTAERGVATHDLGTARLTRKAPR